MFLEFLFLKVGSFLPRVIRIIYFRKCIKKHLLLWDLVFLSENTVYIFCAKSNNNLNIYTCIYLHTLMIHIWDILQHYNLRRYCNKTRVKNIPGFFSNIKRVSEALPKLLTSKINSRKIILMKYFLRCILSLLKVVIKWIISNFLSMCSELSGKMYSMKKYEQVP